jgi:hypothetical protein
MHSRCISVRFPIVTQRTLLRVVRSRGGISGMRIPETARDSTIALLLLVQP